MTLVSLPQGTLCYWKHTLQSPWGSCCNLSDYLSTNDKVLQMQDFPDPILHHRFYQQVSKSNSDKIFPTQTSTKIEKSGETVVKMMETLVRQVKPTKTIRMTL
jgi:hypothetical protein